MLINKKQWFFICTIILIAFNLSFFIALGLNIPKEIWICYAFAMVSIICLYITPLFAKEGRLQFSSNISLFGVNVAFLLFEFYISFSCVSNVLVDVKALLVKQILLLSVYIVLFILLVVVNRRTQQNINQQDAEVHFIKNNASQIKNTIGKINNSEYKELLERLYSLLHSSPSKSNPSVALIENDITNSVEELVKAINNKDYDDLPEKIDVINKLINERNNQLKALK